MTTIGSLGRRNVLGFILAGGTLAVVAVLWLWVEPWIETTWFSELATVGFVVLAAAALTVGEMIWTRLNPTH